MATSISIYEYNSVHNPLIKHSESLECENIAFSLAIGFGTLYALKYSTQLVFQLVGACASVALSQDLGHCTQLSSLQHNM